MPRIKNNNVSEWWMTKHYGLKVYRYSMSLSNMKSPSLTESNIILNLE
jgi:hypothetical protein